MFTFTVTNGHNDVTATASGIEHANILPGITMNFYGAARLQRILALASAYFDSSQAVNDSKSTIKPEPRQPWIIIALVTKRVKHRKDFCTYSPYGVSCNDS